MAEYQGEEYGLPYPRVDQYGNPVPPVDHYGNPIPREPAASGLGGTTPAPPYSAAGDKAAGHVQAPVSAGYRPHDGTGTGIVTAPLGATGVAHHSHSGGVAPGETALAYEGMVGAGGVGAATAGNLQPTREEERTFGMGAPTKEEHTTTLGEKLRRSGSSSSSSSSSEDDGQGGRRKKKKSIKEKIKEKLPGGTHKHQQEQKAAGHVVPATAPTTTTTGTGTGPHAAGTHEKKGLMEKIKEKLPGHH